MSTTLTADPVRDGGDPAAAPTAPRVEFSFVIEFQNATNATILCPITRRIYRSAWINSNVRGRMPDDKFSRMPDLPGIQIAVETRGRRVAVVDPLGRPENADILSEANAVHRQMSWGAREPDEAAVFQDLPADTFKLWAYWCRRWIDNKDAVLVSGEVPEMRTIERLPGRIEHNQFDASPKRDKFPDEADRPAYMPPPAPRARRT